ncbi:diguanylate cyclase [Desulfovibrio sp. DS-1]|nr:diguanylate cyclase [Desulfovibrio sp. DS-1]
MQDVQTVEPLRGRAGGLHFHEPTHRPWQPAQPGRRGSAHHRNAQTQRAECSCLVLDMDYFKRVNDTYGHPTADVALQTVSAIIMRNIRKADFAARLGERNSRSSPRTLPPNRSWCSPNESGSTWKERPSPTKGTPLP